MSGVQLDNFANEISCNFGFAVKLEWLGEVLQLLQTAHAGGFLHMPREQQLQLVLEQLLNADLRVAGAGGHLPAAVKVRKTGRRGGGPAYDLVYVCTSLCQYRVRAHCLLLTLTDILLLPLLAEIITL